MAQYCDTKKLEREWFNWLLSTSTPKLESYRKIGVLYTKMCDCVKNKDGSVFIDKNGKTYPDPLCKTKIHFIMTTNELITTEDGEEIDRQICECDLDGFVHEAPTEVSWDNMLIDINNMCTGISTKFNLASDEEYHELASETLIQVANKLVNRKLVYTPGKAPVFNLLTTTIYRCIFSILSKRNRKRNQARSFLTTDDESSMIKTKHLCKSYMKIKEH